MLRVIAIGTRMPTWVDAAFEDYTRRLRGSWALEFTALSSASRGKLREEATRARSAEAERILALLSPRDYVVALDEHGAEPTTVELKDWLEERRGAGRPITFIVGGADGLDAAVLARSQYRWALSRLTLPHGLARVVLVEQLYRASTLLARHPYHRE
jgi:23S rRNA (pseudouridine1915-N3)-methyltransferase